MHVPCLSINIDLPIAIALKKIFNLLGDILNQDPDVEPESAQPNGYGINISLNTGDEI